MEDDPSDIITTTSTLCDKGDTIHAVTVVNKLPDPRARLAQKLLEVSMIAPKYQGQDKPAELMDVEELVVRAFDAADLFFREANMRGCLVDMPSQDVVRAANDAARADREAKRPAAA